MKKNLKDPNIFSSVFARMWASDLAGSIQMESDSAGTIEMASDSSGTVFMDCVLDPPFPKVEVEVDFKRLPIDIIYKIILYDARFVMRTGKIMSRLDMTLYTELSQKVSYPFYSVYQVHVDNTSYGKPDRDYIELLIWRYLHTMTDPVHILLQYAIALDMPFTYSKTTVFKNQDYYPPIMHRWGS